METQTWTEHRQTMFHIHFGSRRVKHTKTKTCVDLPNSSSSRITFGASRDPGVALLKGAHLLHITDGMKGQERKG